MALIISIIRCCKKGLGYIPSERTASASAKVVTKYEKIALGDVSIAFLGSGNRAKSARDAAVGMFKSQVLVKGLKAGRVVDVIDEKFTTMAAMSGLGASEHRFHSAQIWCRPRGSVSRVQVGRAAGQGQNSMGLEESGIAWVRVLTVQPDIECELTDIDDIVALDERDPRRRPFIENARRQLAERFPHETRGTLRLKLGWSQRRLAEEIGTSQPRIARIEFGQDIMLGTARRLAAALGVSLLDIDAAIRASKTP